MIKSAIFDVDGTLLDSMKIWDNAGERYLSSVGKTAENGLSEKLCDMSLTEGAEYMKKQYALSFSTDEIVSGVLKIIEDFYFYEVGLKNDAKEILQFLESNNIKMIIATSSDKTHIKKAFERLGILKYFTDIVTCSQIGKAKQVPTFTLPVQINSEQLRVKRLYSRTLFLPQKLLTRQVSKRWECMTNRAGMIKTE